MFLKVQKIWYQFKSRQMCIYGIFKDDLGFYYFQGRETTRFLKIQVIVNMPPLKNPKQIDVFNGMALFYKCFIKNFDAIMALITKLNRKTKTFLRRAFCTEITQRKILDAGHQWPTTYRDMHDYYRSCDACQRTGGLVIQSLAKLVTSLLE